MDDVIMDVHLGMDSSLLAYQHLHSWNQVQGNTVVRMFVVKDHVMSHGIT